MVSTSCHLLFRACGRNPAALAPACRHYCPDPLVRAGRYQARDTHGSGERFELGAEEVFLCARRWPAAAAWKRFAKRLTRAYS